MRKEGRGGGEEGERRGLTCLAITLSGGKLDKVIEKSKWSPRSYTYSIVRPTSSNSSPSLYSASSINPYR